MKHVLTLLLVWCLTPVLSQAQEAEISAEERERDARALFEMASRHYETGRLEEAIEEYERAYSLAPIPAFQYNLYLAHRDAGNTAEAAAALRSYLDTAEDIPAEDRASLERRYQLLAERVPEPDPAPEPEDAEYPHPDARQPPPLEQDPIEPPLEPEPPEHEPPPSEGGLSPLVGGVTLGVGGALLVGALIEGLVANAQKSDLDAICNDDGCLEAEQNDIVSRFETHRNVAWGLLAAGAAVSATGVVLLLLSGDGDSEDRAFNVSCDGRGCLGDLRLVF